MRVASMRLWGQSARTHEQNFEDVRLTSDRHGLYHIHSCTAWKCRNSSGRFDLTEQRSKVREIKRGIHLLCSSRFSRLTDGALPPAPSACMPGLLQLPRTSWSSAPRLRIASMNVWMALVAAIKADFTHVLRGLHRLRWVRCVKDLRTERDAHNHGKQRRDGKSTHPDEQLRRCCPAAEERWR